MRVNGEDRYRYAEKTPQQAIVLKLARVTTGIQATWAVLCAGFTQEAAALQRILDETGSDISFLAGPLTIGQHESAHDKFLLEFFQEEFDEGKTPIQSTQKRDRVPRKKIRAYNARTYTAPDQVDEASAVLSTIDSVYSGYIHSAGIHTMDTYGGAPPRFHVQPQFGTDLLDAAFADFRNHLFRAITHLAIAGFALQQYDVSDRAKSVSDAIGKEFNTF